MIFLEDLDAADLFAVDVDNQIIRLEASPGSRGTRDHLLNIGRRPLDDVGDENDAMITALACFLAWWT